MKNFRCWTYICKKAHRFSKFFRVHKSKKGCKWLLDSSFKEGPTYPPCAFSVSLSFSFQPLTQRAVVWSCQCRGEGGSDFGNTGWLSLIYILFLPFMSVALGRLPGFLAHWSSVATGYTRGGSDWWLGDSGTLWSQWLNAFGCAILGWITNLSPKTAPVHLVDRWGPVLSVPLVGFVGCHPWLSRASCDPWSSRNSTTPLPRSGVWLVCRKHILSGARDPKMNQTPLPL